MRIAARETVGLGSTAHTWVVAAVVIVAGVGLAFSTVTMSPLYVFGGVLGLLLVGGFLLQPYVLLLALLIGRASSDLSVQIMGSLGAASGSSLGSLINIGLILALILGGGFYILAWRIPVFRLPGGILLALLLLAGITAVFRADDLVTSFRQWLPVVGGFVTYSLSSHLFSTPRRVERLAAALAVSLVLPAVFGLHQLVSGTPLIAPPRADDRLLGTFVHPNAFALYLVVIISVFLSQAVDPARHHRVLSFSIVGLSLVLLVGTLTRIAWIGAVVVMLVIGALRRSRILLLLVPLVAVGLWLVIPAVQGRVEDPLGGSFADRVDLWTSLLNDLMRETGAGEPWTVTTVNRLTGLGPGSVEPLSLRTRWAAFAAHNDYVRVLIEYGVFGLVLYVALVFIMIAMAYRTWRIAPEGSMRAVALAFLAVAIAFPIMSLTENIFAATQNQLYFWALAGTSVAIARFGARTARADDSRGEAERDG